MTTEHEKQREIDRLRATIEQECQTLTTGLQGLTGAARHTYVSERMKTIGTHTDELATKAGTHEALAFTLDAMARAKLAQSDAPPTFLRVGDVMISLSHIVLVHREHDNDSVLIDTSRRESYLFHGKEAALFMELFQAHCRILSSSVDQRSLK